MPRYLSAVVVGVVLIVVIEAGSDRLIRSRTVDSPLIMPRYSGVTDVATRAAIGDCQQ